MNANPVFKDAAKYPADPNAHDENEVFIDSRALFGHRKQVAIMHNGSIYRLKITRFGKLILNK